MYTNPVLTRERIQGRSYRLTYRGQYVGEIQYERACGGSSYVWSRKALLDPHKADDFAKECWAIATNALPPRIEDAMATIELALQIAEARDALIVGSRTMFRD